MSTYKGRALGTIGHIGCFSFHETKNYTAGGEGGATPINDKALIERAEIIREKGTNRSQFFRGQVDKYTWRDIGSSDRRPICKLRTCGRNWKQRIVSTSNVCAVVKRRRCVSASGESRAYRAAVDSLMPVCRTRICSTLNCGILMTGARSLAS